MTEITLKFTESNNFDIIHTERGTSGEPKNIIKNAYWFIDCALSAIQESYNVGAPRRIEMEKIHADLMKQLENQEKLIIKETEG